MSPRGRSPKRQPSPSFADTSEINPTQPSAPPQEKFPYEEGQVCADVKIVEIKPKVERSIGFVYAKRGIIKDNKDRIVNTDGILQGQWETRIHWMTISDFKLFVKAQLESGQFVRGEM